MFHTDFAADGTCLHISLSKLDVSAEHFASQSVKGNKAFVAEADLPEGFIASPKQEGPRTPQQTKLGDLHNSLITANIRYISTMTVPACPSTDVLSTKSAYIRWKFASSHRQ